VIRSKWFSRIALATTTLTAVAAGLAAPGAATTTGKVAGGGGVRSGFQIIDVDGLKDLVRQGRGHVVLLHFWASWCYPCLQELPLIDKFAHDTKARGLDIVSVSLDDPTRMGPRVAALLRKSAPHLTPHIIQFGNADDLIAAVDPRWEGAIPALFVYDHLGQLRGNLIGAAERAELDALVGGLLKAADKAANRGAPPPTTAVAVPTTATTTTGGHTRTK
jgi:thiol-disulfide isomerase/thioredoxin